MRERMKSTKVKKKTGKNLITSEGWKHCFNILLFMKASDLIRILAIKEMGNNTARNWKSWLIFCLNDHTCQGGWGKYIWVACHSVNNRHRTQRLLSSTDSEDCFPLFLIKRQKAIDKSSECSSRSTASQRQILSYLLKKHPGPSHIHTHIAPPLLPAELHRATDVTKGHRDCKQTHFLHPHQSFKKADSPKH